MFLAERHIKDLRLKVYNDIDSEDSFIVKTSELVFARINKINEKWCVWLYKYHVQRNFQKLQNCLRFVNKKFLEWIGE